MREVTILDVEAYLWWRSHRNGAVDAGGTCQVLRDFFDLLQLYGYIAPRDNPFSNRQASLRVFQRLPAQPALG